MLAMMMMIVEGEGTVLGVNLGRPVVTSGDGDALFPNYFGEDLGLRACMQQRAKRLLPTFSSCFKLAVVSSA